MWFRRKDAQAKQMYQIGDKVWVNTFVNSYKGTVVGFAPPNVTETGERVIVDIDGRWTPVTLDLLSRQEDK